MAEKWKDNVVVKSEFDPITFSENSNHWWKSLLKDRGKTLQGIVSKLLKTKSLLTSPSNVLPYSLK